MMRCVCKEVFLDFFSETEEVQYQLDCHLLSLFYLLLFLTGHVLSVTFLSSRLWLKIWRKKKIIGTDHKHIPDYSLSVLSFYPDSFLLRQFNMCLVLADSHVYKVHICVHVQYTLFEQSITVTIIDGDTRPFLKFQPVFFFFYVLIFCW